MTHFFAPDSPIYVQLKKIIRMQIENEAWPAGQPIPTEVEIAHQYGVSRNTVRQAILDLVREGLLTRRRGRGTYVAEPKIETDMAAFWNITSGLLGDKLGSVHRSVDQRVIRADRSVARNLKLDFGSPVVQIVRLRLVNGDPIILETFYVPHDVAPGLENEDLTGHFLYPLLVNRYGVVIHHVETWLEPTILDEYEAEQLGVSRYTPSILIRRQVSDATRPIVSTKMLLRGDRCKYVMRWEHPGTSIR